MNDLLAMHKRIDVERSPVLFDRPFSPERFLEDWEVKSATWSCEGSSLVGRNPAAGPGVIMSRASFPGNVLVDFHAQTVLPSTHDIDVMWNLSWDEKTNQRGAAYVVGVQGWWDGKIGIEKSPEYKLCVTVPCPWFTPGREYHIQVGSVDGHCFVFVDGVLRLELHDPDPIDSSRHNRVGFEAYQSMIRINRLTVRQIVWEKRAQQYEPEF
jgi:hypothetical protein